MEIKKALTFRASSIGDCLMGKYLLENIHIQFPEARLGIVVASRGAMIRDLFAAYEWLEVVEVSRRDPRALWNLWRQWRGSDFVVTQYAGKPGGRFSIWSKLFGRAVARRGGLVGFTDASPWNTALYDILLSFEHSSAPASLERKALKAMDIPVAFPYPTMRHVPMPGIARAFGLRPGRYIIVHVFAGSKARGLRPDKRRELVAALAEKMSDTRLVLTGGKGDRDEALNIAESVPATVIAGQATLQELMNLMDTSAGVVSVDTGVAHMAAQLCKPLAVLTSCLGSHWWREEQYGKESLIVVFSRANLCVQGHINQDYPICMNGIDMEKVALHVVRGIHP